MNDELTRRQQAALVGIATSDDDWVSSYLLTQLVDKGYAIHIPGRGWRVTQAGHEAVRRSTHRDVYATHSQNRMHFWLLRYSDVLIGEQL